MPSNYTNPCHTDEEQNDDNVAVYAVDNEQLVSNDRDELKAHEKSGREDSREM
jgi:hypothetical protein